MSSIERLLRDRQNQLLQERAGVQSARQAHRDVARLRQPAKKAATLPPPVTTDVKSTSALTDVLDVLHDAGVIDNQSTAGNDPIVPLSDSAAALDDLTTTGFVVRTGPGGYAVRKIRAPYNGLSISPPGDGVSSDGTLGDIVLLPPSFLNTLAVTGGSFSTQPSGLIASNGVGGSAAVVITAGSNIAVTDGDGINGSGLGTNPIIAVVSSPEFNSLIVDGLIRWGAVNGTPTITFAAGAGSGASLTSYTGGDYAGKLVFHTGTGPAAGGQASIVFQNALANANYRPSMISFGSAGAGLQPYITAQANTGWSFGFNVAPAASTTYTFEIGIAGR